MKNPLARLTKRTGASEIETELATLAKRRVDIERRRSELLLALDDAKQTRLATLSEEGGDIEAASRKIRETALGVEDLADVLSDIQRQTDDAHQRLAAARDHDTRKDAAARLEKIAAAVDSRISPFNKAVAELAKVARELIGELPDDLGLWEVGYYDSRPDRFPAVTGAHVTKSEVLAGILADALCTAMPELESRIVNSHKSFAGIIRFADVTGNVPLWSPDAITDPLPVKSIVPALISDRLRDRAAAILEGATGASIVDIVPEPPEPARDTRPDVVMFILKPFSYIGSLVGPPQFRSEGWTDLVPAVVADIAERRGLALRLDKPEGAAAFEAEKKRRSEVRGSVVGNTTNHTIDDYLPLGDVMNIRRTSAEAAEAARATA